MRAELAAQMTDGSPCPVCGSLDHPDPVDAESFPPVSRDEEEAAFQLPPATRPRPPTRRARRWRRPTPCSATWPSAWPQPRQPFRPGRSRPATAGGLDAAAADAATLATAAQSAAAAADALEAGSSRLSAAAATSAARQRELDELDQSIAADQTRLAELTEQRTAALAEAAAAAARAAARRAELAAQLGDGEDLESAIAAAASLAEALLSAAALAEQLADPDLAVDLDPPAPVAAATRRGRRPPSAPWSEASTELGTARHRAEQLARLVPRLDAALAALAPGQERAAQVRHLADLANGTSSANQYKMTLSSFVLAARLEEVAAAASERLLTMTAGRYSLVHSDARRGNAKAGLSLLACDAWTGVDRDTATLSGGETFLASLALALGLADVVTAESAGTPMEALFVDEGFGTLDEETLDEVMNVLDGLRAGGRIVGIVSHVAELRSARPGPDPGPQDPHRQPRPPHRRLTAAPIPAHFTGPRRLPADPRPARLLSRKLMRLSLVLQQQPANVDRSQIRPSPPGPSELPYSVNPVFNNRHRVTWHETPRKSRCNLPEKQQYVELSKCYLGCRCRLSAV